MNKSYKSVWNESTGSWVAVSELATGRSKSKRAKTAISKAILTQIAVGGMSLAGAGVAMADDTVKSGTNATVNIADGVAIGVDSLVDADAAAPTKIGGIAIGDSAYSIGSGVAVGQNSQASSDSLAFGSAAVAGNGGTAIGANAYTINNGGVAIGQSASATGSGAMALGMNASASGSGSVALGQDSVATDKNTISVGNATTQRQIANLAAGTHATDAVNLGQLAAAGLNINTSGVVTNAFVAYDTTAKTGVTLGTGTVGAQIHQLAAGTVATDAVNVGQLTAAGLNINTSGVVQNAFVAYDTTAKTGVTLGVGTAGAQIHNLVAGVADTDATNVAQLKALGATIGTSGTVTNSFVSYSTTGKDLVTLLGASGTKISNVAAGTVGATSKDAINGSQLYAAENSVATILGGSAGVNADGTIKAPTYTVGGKTYNTLDSALTAAAAATGTGGSAANSVVYDQVGQTSVTLGAAGTPVKISNVANGTTANDAVNLSQLTSATAGLATSVANSKFIGISAVMNGSQAQASGQDAVSIGGNAVASGDETLAFGTNSKATALNSIAIGYGSNANQANTVSIGSLGKERRLTNVAAGTGNTDAVNLGQVMTLLANESTGLQATLKSSPTLLGASSPALLGASGGLLGAVTPITLDQVIAVGPTNKLGSISAIGTDSVSIGLNTSSTNTNSVAIGSNINSVGVNSVAMGYGTIANGSNSMAFGSNATSVSDGGLSIGNSSAVDVDSPDGIAIGTNAESANDRAIVIGKNSGATGVQSLALGNQSMALADGSFIIGNNSTVTGTNSYVLGSNNAKVSGSNSVVLGNGSDGTQSNVISVGAKGSERKIVNVAAGTTTTDAVNLGQMTTAIASATASTGANPNAVSYDTSAHDKITLGTAGTAGTPVTIANVADGKANNDAVNVEQLKAAGLNVDTNGVVQNAFVAYDSTAKTGVTLGNGTVGAQIHKLVAGTTATDAVNLGQLTAAGLIVNSSGVAQNAFVAYDSTAKTGVTLGTGTVGAQIHQVVAGTTTTDAVNLGQLAAAGIIVNSSGVVQNAFVAYDSTAKTGVTLGTGTVGAQIHQVVAGTTTTDAVNLGQLAAAGIIVNSSGVVQNAFVAYDSTAKTGVTLGTGTVGAQIHQVVAGTTTTDAVNLGQLAAAGIIVNSSGVVQNAFVAYDSTAKTGVTLGTGTVGAQIHQVVAGTTATDAVNLGQMTTAIASAVTTGGANPNAVSYDTSAHDKITLGTTGTAGTPVTIANVADGKANNDAVNVEQLKAAGLNVDTNGVVQNAFVAYDSTAKTGVTLGNGTVGAQIHQVVAGTTTTDAVNLGQLQAAGIVVNSSGVVQNAFVAYDSTAKTGVTLGTGTVGAQIHQVVAGTTTTDAVNLGQLAAAGIIVNSSGVVQNAFVAYDSTAKTGVTLGNGTVGAQIHKLVAGTTATDAVNLGQLTAAGLVVNSSGVAQNAFVAYDSTAKTGVTLGTGTVGAQIHQVVAGTTATDAVNLGQLAAAGIIVNSSGVVQNAFVAYDSTAKTGVTLGVGTAGAQIHNLVAGVADTDATNVAQLKAMGATFNSSGVVQNTFVAYDSTAKTSVTLGTAGTPVKVANVADGVANNDAVNVEQLNSAISTATSANQILSSSLKYVRFGASSAATAQATGTDSMAIGGNAFANSTGGLAFGLNSRATGANSVALGTGSLASVDNTVSVGTQFAQRRIVNVADATGNNDAVNLGQVETMLAGVTATQTPVKSVQQLSATRLGSNADGSPATVFALTDVMGVGTTDKLGQVETSGTDSIAIGLNTKANADNTVSIGTNVSATANQAVAIGSAVIANGVGATAIGVNASVIADRALAIGNGSDAETTDSIALGTSAAVGGAGTSGIAIGNGAAVSGSGTIVMGNNSSASGTNTVVIGNNIVGSKANTYALGSNSVILGNGSDGSQSNVVSIGAKGSERKIVNVAAGTTTTDAVNLGQMTSAIAAAGTGGGGSTLITQAAAGADLLVGGATDGTHVNFANNAGVARELLGVAAGTKATSAVNLSQLTPVVAALGGGAAINSTTGAVTGPTYSIGGHTTTNAGDAFKDVDTGLTNLNNAVAAISADTGGTGLVAQDPTTQNITVGKMTGGTVVDVTNSSGVQRTITGVAAGAVNSSSFDAINGSQLFNNGQSIATAIGGGAQMNSDGSFTQPTFNVGGGTVHNVGDAISNLDSRVTQNADNVTNLQTTVNNITAGGGVAAPNAVSYDSSAHDQITMAGTAGTKLTNLTAGTLAAGSTDAVTGDQLYTTNQDVAALQASVTNIAATGSTSIGINGINGTNGADGTPAAAASATGSDAIAMGDNASASGDHAVVIGGGASGTGDGTIAIGGNAGASGTNSIAIGNGATAPANNAVALGANSVADRDNSVSVGSQGNERQITNVAAGTQGTDAVNLNQMNSAVGGIARKAYSGIAAATALTMIPDVDANKTLSIGIGGGTFQGYAASAIGGTARITQNIKVRVGAGWSAAGTTVGAGASYQW